MQSNFGDVRFVNASGTAAYSYWLEKFSTSTSATFWVKIPSIPASGQHHNCICTMEITPTSSQSTTSIFFE